MGISVWRFRIFREGRGICTTRAKIRAFSIRSCGIQNREQAPPPTLLRPMGEREWLRRSRAGLFGCCAGSKNNYATAFRVGKTDGTIPRVATENSGPPLLGWNETIPLGLGGR